ncbi:hypothetical protein OTC26_000275 [Streptomyces tirandamycinicus]|uniref:hypothetical protein n=1 Tax=Streptomyces tirandamycinicus TaxID=2174846 RepID=UPI00226D7C57|nr:hypothetical protein [Streptomyces tirandamycinicus]MCY0982105.1 hypothetical protein [Streptomyces tirandamycinicus]
MAKIVTPLPAVNSPVDIAYQQALRLNTSMMSVYEENVAAFQKNLLSNHPVILALFSGAGGEFTLYQPDQEPLHADPVSLDYQLAKSVAHSSMAVYQLVIPYIGDPANSSWHAPLQIYRMQQEELLRVFGEFQLSSDPREAIEAIVRENIAFMDQCLRSGTFNLEGLDGFTRRLKPKLAIAIEFAAEEQVSHWMDVLDGWKQMLGDSWERTYGVVNSLYVTRTNNVLFTIMAQYFGRDAFNDRLLLFETSSFTTEREHMLDLLTRIVADRALGKVFFGDYFLMDSELLQTGARDAITAGVAPPAPTAPGGFHAADPTHAKIATHSRNRGLEPLLPPTVPFHSREWPWHTRPEEGEGPRSMSDTDLTRG